MRLTIIVGLSIYVLSALPACGGAIEDEGSDVAEGRGAIVLGNAIVPNAIVPNAIVPNAIVPNAIVSSALSMGALDSASLDAIRDPGRRGTLSRMFLKYVVSCALDATQSLTFDWTDGANVVHEETYVGLVGLATSWATAPLMSVSRQRLVSSCLGARTNFSGTSVTISIRSTKDPLADDVSPAELSAYPHVEGAFWGNLFGGTPRMYACYKASNMALSRASLRECATGHVEPDGQVVPCGAITITGTCGASCRGFDSSDGAYTSCGDPEGEESTTSVITTALP